MNKRFIWGQFIRENSTFVHNGVYDTEKKDFYPFAEGGPSTDFEKAFVIAEFESGSYPYVSFTVKPEDSIFYNA